VDFRNGQLSVIADDAELGKLLHQIGSKIGAAVDVAPEVAGERVVAHLGPAPAAEVLPLLLSSPRLDFILMGAPDGDEIGRLIVCRKASLGKEEPQAQPHTSPDPLPATEDHTSGEESDQPSTEPQPDSPPR
jgi:hypothetical protein